jgi:hypothetical protein
MKAFLILTIVLSASLIAAGQESNTSRAQGRPAVHGFISVPE